MNTDLFIDKLVTKSLEILPDMANGERFFEGYLTIEMKDKQGEITLVDELYKVLPIWVDRGAPITDTHSNRVIGKGINFARAVYKDGDGAEYPAIKITGKIHKNYELDDDIWGKIKSGEYKGLSFGGATKSDRKPRVMKDGSVAYELKNLEHYEVAVCKDPAVPLALITDYNPLAKAVIPNAKHRGDGDMVIQCDKFRCYVVKHEGEDEPEYHDESVIPVEKHDTGEPHTHEKHDCKNKNEICPNCDPEFKKKDKKKEDFSNADLTTAQYTQNIDEGGMGKDGRPKEDDTHIKKESTATSGTGGGVRGIPNEVYNQTAPNDQTVQNTELEDSGDKLEEDDNADNKMMARVSQEMNPEKGLDLGQTDRRHAKSGYTTEDGNIKLGDERGDSNAIEEEKTHIKKSNYCPSCGDKISENTKRDYPETQSQGALCPSCRQNKQIKERDAKGKLESDRIGSNVHRELSERMGKHGVKVQRF